MKNTLPVMLLKGLLVLPNQDVKIELNNNISKDIIDLAEKKFKSEIIVINPLNQIEEVPDINDLPNIGVVTKIKSAIVLPNGNLRVVLRGLFRIKTLSYKNNPKNRDILECMYQKLEVPEFNKVESVAYKRKLSTLLKTYIKNGQGVSNSILSTIKDINDLNKLTDIISSFLPMPFENKLEYIEEINPLIRAEKLIDLLNLELESIKIDKKIDEKLRTSLENGQREYILKEKIKEIQEELGEDDLKKQEIESYLHQLDSLNLTNEKTIKKIQNEIKRIELTSDQSPELGNIRNYLDWILNLPWNNESKDNDNLEDIEKKLNQTHYGLEAAKSKVLEYIAAKKRNPKTFSPILCLVGPAGVGKTTFAKAIATSLNKEFYKINVGGLSDSAILNGHRRTYLGSSPGKIIEALKRTGVNNPLILIDEVDKMVRDNHSDPASTLLDILDKTQNDSFVDNYIEEPFDLSNIFFVLTANYINDIPYELLDRLEVINLYSYTINEKVEIAKKYLIPNILKEYNIAIKNIKLNDLILKSLIEEYTYESGVRDLERTITSLIRKLILKNNLDNPKITKELLLELLGPGKYKKTFSKKNSPGIVNILAVTSIGGVVDEMESIFFEGKGKVFVTGNLERIMEESIDVVFSYLKANKDLFKINDYYFYNKDIHLHFLAAATKKDGPSAGISIATSILSLLLNKEVPKNVAFTGELTLNGNLKAVGGIKEKIIAAYNEGINKIFIPEENHNDLNKISTDILNKLEIIEVSNYLEVYNNLFN